MRKSEEIGKRFEGFLREHGAFKEFCRNLKKYDRFNNITELIDKIKNSPEDFICEAFVWDTPEGIGYWGNLNIRWIKECKNQGGAND